MESAMGAGFSGFPGFMGPLSSGGGFEWPLWAERIEGSAWSALAAW